MFRLEIEYRADLGHLVEGLGLHLLERVFGELDIQHQPILDRLQTMRSDVLWDVRQLEPADAIALRRVLDDERRALPASSAEEDIDAIAAVVVLGPCGQMDE